MTREEDLRNERLFEGSIGQPNYLGDRGVVESVLRLAVQDMLDRMQHSEAESARIHSMRLSAKNAVEVFLGMDENYAAMSKWNEPGFIDVFLAKWCGSKEVRARARVEHAMIKLFGEVLDLANYATEPGVLEEQWVWQVGATIGTYTSLFMGIDPPMQAILRGAE